MYTYYVNNNGELSIEVSEYGFETQSFPIEISNKDIKVGHIRVIRKPWVHLQDPYRVALLESELMRALRNFDSEKEIEEKLNIKFNFSTIQQSSDAWKFAHETAVFVVKRFNEKRKEERKRRTEEQAANEQKKRNEQKKQEQKRKCLPMLRQQLF